MTSLVFLVTSKNRMPSLDMPQRHQKQETEGELKPHETNTLTTITIKSKLPLCYSNRDSRKRPLLKDWKTDLTKPPPYG
jgi:hypothetical protein